MREEFSLFSICIPQISASLPLNSSLIDAKGRASPIASRTLGYELSVEVIECGERGTCPLSDAPRI